MPTTIEESYSTTEVASQSTSSVSEQLLDSFKSSKEYRHAFVEEKVRTWIAAQIRCIRQQRELKRPAFAKLLGKAPSWIFRLEDPNEPPPTISTLLQVAEAFDVDLDVRFVPFTDFLRTADTQTPESFEVPSFDEELKALANRSESERQALASGRLLRFVRHDPNGSIAAEDEVADTDPGAPMQNSAIGSTGDTRIPPSRQGPIDGTGDTKYAP